MVTRRGSAAPPERVSVPPGLATMVKTLLPSRLGMLKEVAPQTIRVAILGNPKTAVYFDYLLGAAQAVAPTLGIEATPSHETISIFSETISIGFGPAV